VLGSSGRGLGSHRLLTYGWIAVSIVGWEGQACAQPGAKGFLEELARAFGGGGTGYQHQRFGQALGLVALAVGLAALLAALWAWQRRRSHLLEIARSEIEHERSLGAVDSSRLLHRGQELLIEPLGTDLARVHAVRLEGIDPRTLAVPVPSESSGLLEAGRRLAVSFRQGRYSYRFETEIMRRLPGPHPLLLLPRPEKVQRFERREFFRMDAYLPCRFRLDPQQDAPATESPELLLPHTGVITNLSGSGLRLVTDQRVRGRPTITVSFAIDIPEGREHVVARTEPLTCESAEEGGWEVRARFTEIQRSQRERVVAYVVERERELLRQGIRS